MVIDNLAANPDEYVDLAASKVFAEVASYYPGLRSKAPLTYQRFVMEKLGGFLVEYFNLPGPSPRFTSCHFSLVTTAPADLSHPQRIPHVDSVDSDGLAYIHYLFRSDLGGTAFYRHRSTGFEVIDRARKEEYFRRVEEEKQSPASPGPAYINGDTSLYERIETLEGIFNRVLVYRRNSLHSGSLAPDFFPDRNPRSGRLSINGFIA
jgi:hypothetical protein